MERAAIQPDACDACSGDGCPRCAEIDALNEERAQAMKPITHRLCPTTGVRIEIDTFCPRCLHVHVGAVLSGKPCFIECRFGIERAHDLYHAVRTRYERDYQQMLEDHEQDVLRLYGEVKNQ